MSDLMYVRMPNGRVHQYNRLTRVVSGMVPVGESGEVVTPGSWPEWVDECVTGEAHKYIKDLGYKSLGDNVVSFAGFLQVFPSAGSVVEQVGAEEFVQSMGESFGLLECEVRHALESLGDEYEEETVVPLEGGRELRCPAYPAECDYVRICLGGIEIAYWISDEWVTDGTGVMGAIVGAMRGSRRA